jgi:hypothetical protein
VKVLVACEFSGIVRDAFIERGHDAISCDLLPTERPGPHYQGDVRDMLAAPWDLLIAHPPCTYLTNAGVRWLYGDFGHKMAATSLVGPARWDAMREGAEFFRMFLDAPIPRIAVENPIMHRHAIDLIGRRQDQVVQPWMFGDPQQKAVGLWLRGLPPLIASGPIEMERHQLVHKMAPSGDRAKKRSVFFPGIAAAMAAQWGDVALEEGRVMLDLRLFLLNRLSPCNCEEWGIEGWHASDCRHQIEHEFVVRVTAPDERESGHSANVPTAGNLSRSSTAAVAEKRDASRVTG